MSKIGKQPPAALGNTESMNVGTRESALAGIVYSRVKPISALAEVQDQLVRLITERSLVSSDRLPPERDLAAMLGVSRATLREALRGLADRGMVEARQGSGWFVEQRDDPLVNSMVLHFHLGEMSLEHMAEVRRLLEPRTAALAAERRTLADIDALQSQIAIMAPCTDALVFLVADGHFHEAIALAVRNPFFTLAVKPILTMLGELRKKTLFKPGQMRQIHAEHCEIFDAIALGDAGRADAAMNRHLDTFVRRWRIRDGLAAPGADEVGGVPSAAIEGLPEPRDD